MQGVSYTRFLLYGFFAYATIFMLWSLLAAYGMNYGWSAQIASYVVTAIAIAAATRALDIVSPQTALLCGAGWVSLHALLDALYVAPTAGFGPFLTSYVWIAYAIVFFSPVATVLYMKLLKQPAPAQ